MSWPAFLAATPTKKCATLSAPIIGLRAAVLRPPVEERAAPPREPLEDEPDEEPELALASPSTDHLPDMTRCAASATA